MLLSYFWVHKENIPEGVGYGQFTLKHLLLLTFVIIGTILITYAYRKANYSRRLKIRRTIAVILIISDICKLTALHMDGVNVTNYLPLEICSFAAYSIVCDSIWPENKFFPEMLVTLFLPGAIMSLTFPTTTMLPMINYFTIHQFGFHGLIIAYVVARFFNREVTIDYLGVWKSVLKIVGIAAFVYIIDLVFHKDFMFLIHPDGNFLLSAIENITGKGLPYTGGLVVFVIIMIHIFFVVFKLLEKLLPPKPTNS